jgi:adenosine deaminase CECR1
MSAKALGFTDQEWEEISHDVPKNDDPFLQKYLEGREALISQENKQRSGQYTSTSTSTST